MGRSRIPSRYKPTVLPAPKPTDRCATLNPPVANVLKEYRRIRVDGDYLRVHDGDQIPEMRYTANVDNNLGLGNHFNGLIGGENNRHAGPVLLPPQQVGFQLAAGDESGEGIVDAPNAAAESGPARPSSAAAGCPPG